MRWFLTALSVAAVAWTAAAGGGGSGCPDWVPESSFAVRVFRDTDGLPQDTIQSLTLDAAGYLWAATQDGAARFDGSVWTKVSFPERRSDDDFVRCVLGTSDGAVWFGTRSNGLYRLAGGRWTWFHDQFMHSGRQRVNALLETTLPDGKPVLWAGTHGAGLARYSDGAWKWLTTADGLPSNQVWGLGAVTGPHGRVTLWVGTLRGLVRLDPGASRFQQEDGYPTASINSLLVTGEPGTSNQTLWAGSYGEGLFRFHAGRWTRFTREDGLGSNYLTSLATTREPSGEEIVWAGTDGGGIARISGGHIRVFRRDSGLPSSAAYSLLATTAAQGARALWIGTRNNGLVRLMEGKWQRVWPESAGMLVPVLSLAESTGGRGCPELWAGTDGSGLYHWHHGRWEKIQGLLRDCVVQCVLAGGDGAVWAGTRTTGLVEIRGGTLRRYATWTCPLSCNMIQSLAETAGRNGTATLWIGTRRGLFTLEETAGRPIRGVKALRNLSISALLPVPDAAGETSLWASASGRLVHFSHGTWTVLGPEKNLYHAPVRCLMAQRAGAGTRLWVGTEGAGISVLDISREPRLLFTLRATGSGGLSNDVVYWIGEDRAGRIYASTNSGINRLTPTVPLPASAAGFQVTVFNAEDGLLSNQGSIGAGLLDHAGRVLVGTAGGAAALDPSRALVDRTPKKLLLEATLVGPGEQRLTPGCRLGYRNKHIQFHATLFSFFRGRDTRYRVELVGLDTAPSPWSASRTYSYRNLSPGRYTFRIWGRDYAGNVSAPVDFPFQVQPAPWQTLWARSALAVLLLGFVWLAVELRTRLLRARERQLATLVEQRTRELAHANARLQELARRDPLTGLLNRRAFDEMLEAEWRRCRRHHEIFSLILMDIDGFKSWNDRHGHPAGDEVLRAVGEILGRVMARASDMAARIGGDELAVLLPETPLDGAVELAEKTRRAVEELDFGQDDTRERQPTVSCGVVTFGSRFADPQEMVDLADRCLYRAKQAGGNTVISQTGLESDPPH